MSDYPRLFRVRQIFEQPRIDKIEEEVVRQLERFQLERFVRPGQTVAVTAGSRGIHAIHRIIRAVVGHLKALGLQPFIVPAMGSHGGGTADGQRKILESYGITEEFCGCPIRASMETVVVSQAKEGFPVHFDRYAYEADHVMVVARVKPHTGFVGDIESGLMKMLLIGLGKHNGAIIYHRAIQDYSFGQIIRSVAGEVLQKCRILAGLAIVENARDETALVEAVLPQEFEAREKELLKMARQWMPRLPFNAADVLLIDQIGKNISGTGMDTNVVGRKFLDHRAAPDEQPKVRHIVIRDLSEETHGNAAGIGLSEFCRSRVIRKMDVRATRINCLTGGHVTGAMLPLDYETDREILDAAFSVIGLRPPEAARLMWIHHTLDVTELECSEAYWHEAQQRHDLQVLTELRPMPFGPDGNLPDSVHELRVRPAAVAERIS
ncbi:MAG: hypothetical protein KatS3mg110_2073 [Pirellulaceae bacterium]|nr:MAG: hypothetical protein KatS3mg110_2073 [Pirellulaceae bacterium]